MSINAFDTSSNPPIMRKLRAIASSAWACAISYSISTAVGQEDKCIENSSLTTELIYDAFNDAGRWSSGLMHVWPDAGHVSPS